MLSVKSFEVARRNSRKLCHMFLCHLSTIRYFSELSVQGAWSQTLLGLLEACWMCFACAFAGEHRRSIYCPTCPWEQKGQRLRIISPSLPWWCWHECRVKKNCWQMLSQECTIHSLVTFDKRLTSSYISSLFYHEYRGAHNSFYRLRSNMHTK